MTNEDKMEDVPECNHDGIFQRTDGSCTLCEMLQRQVELAVARERERCAKFCDDEAAEWDTYAIHGAHQKERDHGAYLAAMARRFAAKIRSTEERSST